MPASGRHYPCNRRRIVLVGANLGWHETHGADQGRHLQTAIAGQWPALPGDAQRLYFGTNTLFTASASWSGGSRPWSSRKLLNARRSNFAPSASSVCMRSSRIRVYP
ncbi:hypothetical protein G6F63_016753 [Rhizopus arrhizus]|nr:hypothetical protein G6F63_016753 [Rhizopus arrhizus]